MIYDIIPSRVSHTALIFITLLLSILTFQRNNVWITDIILWQNTAKKSPRQVMPHIYIATEYIKNGDNTRAVSEFLKAVSSDINDERDYNNIGIAYYQLGNYQNAILHLKEALRLSPGYQDANYNLAFIYEEGLGDHESAISYYKKLLWLNNGNFRGHFDLGLIYLKEGMFDEAIKEFYHTLNINPDYEEAKKAIEKILPNWKRQNKMSGSE